MKRKYVYLQRSASLLEKRIQLNEYLRKIYVEIENKAIQMFD